MVEQAASAAEAAELSVPVVGVEPGAPAGEPDIAPSPSKPAWSPLASALLAVAIAGAGAAVYAGVAGPGKTVPTDPVAAERTAAVQAAMQEVTNFTTYDYRTVKADFARVSALATGSFASDFRTGSADLQRLIVAGKARSKGNVVAAGAQSFSPDHAVVLLAVDDTVANAKVPKGGVRRYRFSVTVDRVGGRWLVSDLHPVG